MDGDKKKLLAREFGKEYFRIGSVPCPAFGKERVIFDERGFRHLFAKKRQSRLPDDQIRRMRLVHAAVKALCKAQNIISCRVLVKNNRTFKQWAIVEEVNRVMVKVIVGKFNDGVLHFVSVMDKK